MSAPVSSLSLSSCLNSTVIALSQSRPASSTSVVLLMKKDPKKSVARMPEERGGWWRRWDEVGCHISLCEDCFLLIKREWDSPVLVRTLMTASNPTSFWTSRLRSFRNRSWSAWAWDTQKYMSHSVKWCGSWCFNKHTFRGRIHYIFVYYQNTLKKKAAAVIP